MNSILLAVGIVAGIGLLIGLILSVASIIMAVPKDEKAEKILAALPGANCGACGYSGCAGFQAAQAMRLPLLRARLRSGCAPRAESPVPKRYPRSWALLRATSSPRLP